MSQVGRWVVAGALLCALSPTAAWAHGELESSRPDEGAKLNSSPRSVSVTLTESPSDARLQVRDGCGQQVARKTKISGRQVLAAIKGTAEPGKWSARFQAVSAEDDHITKDTFSFTVRGARHCSTEKQASDGEGQDNGSSNTETKGAGSATGGGGQASTTDGGSGTPTLAIVAGAAIVVAAAVGLRRLVAR